MRRESLDAAATAWAMDEIMAGQATSAQLAGFAVLLRAKGETAAELDGLVATMLARAAAVPVAGRSVDLVGTGGDQAHTANISTMAAIVVAGSGRTLVGGNWAMTPPYVVNPGYFSPRAEWDLFEASADRRWTDITRTQRVLGWQLIGTGMLPPDWATVSDVGHAVPARPVTGGPIQFGLDAARVPVRFAESCDREDRALAGAMRSVLTAPGEVPALRNLNGSAASNWEHPVALVAAAATEQGAGNPDGAVERLDAAAQLEQRSPTYYGAAWVALGRIMLTTSLLGECPVAGQPFRSPRSLRIAVRRS